VGYLKPTDRSAEPTEPASTHSGDHPARAGASHLFGKVTLVLVDAFTPEHPGLVLTCETQIAHLHPMLDPNIDPYASA